MDTHLIQRAIVEQLAASPEKILPQNLAKTISATYGLKKTHAKALLKELIAQGELAYIYEFGSTYLEISFNKPVRISKHVVIKPPLHQYRHRPDDVVIQIKPGASFGGGRHPTTRLAIKGIEYVLTEICPGWLNAESSVLDIGTGSGILAISAVGLGVNAGLGIDVDPCARAEAAENVKLNNLEDRLTVSDKAIEAIDHCFSMVTANLRVPTLRKLCVCMGAVTAPQGIVVLSGIRTYELAELQEVYAAEHFECIWSKVELDWVGIVLNKIDVAGLR